MKTETSTYEITAKEFLAKTKAELNIEFLKEDKHFVDDKDVRDIYKVSIIRGQRKYTFEFGQSINNSGFYYTKGKQKIFLDRKLLSKVGLAAIIKSKDWGFLNNGKSDTIHYPVQPNAYDVLVSLTKYDPGTFENFCSEFGYNEDSIKAEKTYKAVKDEYINVCTLFTDEEINELQEIQ